MRGLLVVPKEAIEHVKPKARPKKGGRKKKWSKMVPTREFDIRGHGTLIRIAIHGYERPSAQDYDDANWLNASALVAISGFRAEFSYHAYTTDLARFLDELATLHSTLRGTASLHSLENDVTLEGRVDSLGALHWTCTVQHPQGIGAKLEFGFSSDQSYLPSLIAQLTDILDKYPA